LTNQPKTPEPKSPDLPTHRYVDGVLVELTQAEIDEILRERAEGTLEKQSNDDSR
jgi:hypothetical protein